MSRDAVLRYADLFDARHTTSPGVSSPLGVWLLLALAAPLADGDVRARLEDALGTSADDAAAFAADLLAEPHPAVAAAVAAWTDDARLLPELDTWRPTAVERGPVPDQASADAWAAERTGGLIERFPVELTPETLLVLASALATRISWETPLTEADGLLLLEDGDGWQAVVDTDDAGPVAVASPRSSSGLDVLSVVAAPDVPAEAVHRAARGLLRVPRHELARATVTADGHAWSVAERREVRATHHDVVEEWTSRLPAWRARSEHDVLGSPGVADLVATFERFFRAEDRPVAAEARQSAVASYTATGFEAAAVTAVGLRAGSLPPQPHEVLVREVHVRFDRPHAVVAAPGEGSGAWTRLPVFSAWVAPGRPA